MRRIVVLTANSGTGSNLQALLDAQVSGFDGQIVGVIASSADAYGLVRAHEADVPREVLDYGAACAAGTPRARYEEDLARAVQRYSPDLIVLAGWMLSLGEPFLKYFRWRVIGLHPGLLPSKPGERVRLPDGSLADPLCGLAGENAVKALLASGQTYAGSTVHAVTGEVDAGPVIRRGLVKVRPDDTVATLYDRMKQTEHRIIVESVWELCRQGSTV